MPRAPSSPSSAPRFAARGAIARDGLPLVTLAPPWLRAAGLCTVAVLIATYAWWPALFSDNASQTGDGAFFHKMIEAARVSVTRWHEAPLWNPYECGGVPLWDNPQGVAAAPLVWLALWTGTSRAMALWYMLHAASGVVSMWLFARHELRLTRAAAFVASTSWAFAGVHNLHMAGGHFTWGPYLWHPLVLLLWRRSERDLRAAVGVGALVALSMHEGGVYALPHLALLLAADALTRAWPLVRLGAIARASGVVLLVGLGLGATRFIPVAAQLAAHTRPVTLEHDAMLWSTLKEIFLARTHGWVVPGQEYVWPEFGDYLGPFLLALAFVGACVAGLENAWLLALFALMFACMLGHFSHLAPWSILKGHIYPFKEMRVPSRFVIEVTLFLSAFMGLAIDRVPRCVKDLTRDARLAEAVRFTLAALALVAVGDVVGLGIDHTATCFVGPRPDPTVVPAARLHLGGAGLANFLDQPVQNHGRLECWEEWAFMDGAPLWQGDVPQVKAANGAEARVTSVIRTQNSFLFDVDARVPTRVLVNSTYDKGWRTDRGALANQDKELVLDLPAGAARVRLWYWPVGLTPAAWITAFAAVGVGAFFIADRRRRRRQRLGMISE